MIEKKVMNLTEVSKYLGIPKRTLHDMVRDGRFTPPIKGTSPRLWSKANVEEWLSTTDNG